MQPPEQRLLEILPEASTLLSLRQIRECAAMRAAKIGSGRHGDSASPLY